MNKEQAVQERDADAYVPSLEDKQQEDVERRSAPSAGVVHETIRKEGEEELQRSSWALGWSGLAAGLSMGFSLVTQGLIQSYLPDEPWRPLFVRLGYTVGFLIVILGRQQLFTENTLTPILPLLVRRNTETLMHVLRLWIIVLVTNLIGGFIFAWVIGNTTIFEPRVKSAMAEISVKALNGDFFTLFLRAIFAGWLIALMVWLLPFAEAARIYVIIIVAFLVGLGDFAHIIIGSVEVFYSMVMGQTTFGTYLGQFLIPVLVGNVIGGVALVAVLNHAQVIAGEGE